MRPSLARSLAKMEKCRVCAKSPCLFVSASGKYYCSEVCVSKGVEMDQPDPPQGEGLI